MRKASKKLNDLGSHQKFFMTTSQSVIQALPISPPMIFSESTAAHKAQKTIALDWRAERFSLLHKKPMALSPTCHRRHGQDPKDWIEAAEQSIGEASAKLGALKDEVRGIGVSGQQHGLVVLDQEDRVVRPAKLWNEQRRAPSAIKSPII